jgi:GNAT superfamily N-acetyltransferase
MASASIASTSSAPTVAANAPRRGTTNGKTAAAVANRAAPPAGSISSPDNDYVWPLGVSARPVEAATAPVVECGPAGAGDHASIHQLLAAVFQSPSRDDFSAALEDPLYEPCDRLIVKRGAQVVSHVHVANRVMRFGRDAFPASMVYRMATLPEYRGRGYARRLLDQADSAMRSDGAVLGLLTTRIPHFFRASGWVVCMRHSHAELGARDMLAQLSARGFAPHTPDDAVNIRPWRHVELPSLVRLYQEQTAGTFGPVERTEAYWRWLVNRQATNRQGTEGIFVALAGPKRFDFDFDDAAIVGYCIQREDRILEIAATPGRPGVKERLLARACGEAIERDHHVVRLHLPPNDSLWSAVQSAGGTIERTEQCHGEVTMVKLFDPLGFLNRLLPVLHERAQAAELRRPVDLGIVVDDLKLRVTATRRSVKVTKGSPGRNVLTLSSADFTRLLLGHLDLGSTVINERVRATNRPTLQLAAALFPRLPLWHPPLDDLLV